MLGKKIKKYLDDKGIRYTKISELTGIPLNILSPMLNEKREIKATEYFLICNAISVPLDTFADVQNSEKAG